MCGDGKWYEGQHYIQDKVTSIVTRDVAAMGSDAVIKTMGGGWTVFPDRLQGGSGHEAK